MSARNTLESKSRRRSERAVIQHPARTSPKPPLEKLVAKLSRLSMRQLVRRAHQFEVRVKGAEHIRRALSPGSVFTPKFAGIQLFNAQAARLCADVIAARKNSGVVA